MKNTMSTQPTPPSDDDIRSFLRLYASTLTEATNNYLSFLSDTYAWFASLGGVDAAIPEEIRREALTAAGTLAEISRDADGALMVLGAGHPATPLVTAGIPLGRALTDSYILIAAQAQASQLDDVPLAGPDTIEYLRAQGEALLGPWSVPFDQLR